MQAVEERDVVIVGGGICGLATALALHRKGIESLVLESSESLRSSGAAITIRTNGWLALDHLGVGDKIRKNATPLQAYREVGLDSRSGMLIKTEAPLSKGEVRCVKRSELIEALAGDLPDGTIRLGCRVLYVETDPVTSFPVLQLSNGSTLKAKVLIGCDGVNSVVLDYLEMNPTMVSYTSAVRGFTSYPAGHKFDNVFAITKANGVILGWVPVNDNLVYWFITRLWTSQDSTISRDQELIRMLSLQSIQNFPAEMTEMIKRSDKSSLSSMRFRYRAPWDLLYGRFRKGTVTVAGDALHAMSPFIGQGGSASLEDSIVLARCLSKKLSEVTEEGEGSCRRKYEEALANYVEERRMRLLGLSVLSYVLNKLNEGPCTVVKIVCVLILIVFFRDRIAHTAFDCGQL
ncbi:monooxygenase 1-like [Rhodamnia argentea]|uniref:Monooxygenase 1-like n=1 Tax=Rhodamnia argentea TaxID=178133 RepID=A0ABM3H1P8_9MYRT|nr:monooxygenase 1-like [Rhodamnia argentea]